LKATRGERHDVQLGIPTNCKSWSGNFFHWHSQQYICKLQHSSN